MTTRNTDVPEMMVFTGTSNPELSQKIVQKLGLRLGNATIGRFSDGETSIEIDENVREIGRAHV